MAIQIGNFAAIPTVAEKQIIRATGHEPKPIYRIEPEKPREIPKAPFIERRFIKRKKSKPEKKVIENVDFKRRSLTNLIFPQFGIVGAIFDDKKTGGKILGDYNPVDYLGGGITFNILGLPVMLKNLLTGNITGIKDPLPIIGLPEQPQTPFAPGIPEINLYGFDEGGLPGGATILPDITMPDSIIPGLPALPKDLGKYAIAAIAIIAAIYLGGQYLGRGKK